MFRNYAYCLQQRLRSRYNLSSRKTLYSRIKALNLKLDKDSNNKSLATVEQIEELDRLNEHLKKGGNLKNYVPVTEVTIDDTTTQHSLNSDTSSIIETTQHNEQLTTQYSTQVTPELLGNLVAVIASKLTPPDPLWYMDKLEKAIAHNWELTTSEVQQLIGVKPYCKKGENTYKRGSFIFVKTGRIGNQTSWRVKKVAY
jgi:hypothetical protein